MYCIEYPEFLIKSLESEEHANNLCEGNIIMRSYNYYSHSDNERKYGVEFETNNMKLCNPAFIFCMHDSRYNYKSETDKTKFYVRIKSVEKLFGKIKNMMQPILHTVPAEFKKIDYKCELQHNVADLPFLKPISFAHEQEWRMCFFYTHEKVKQVENQINKKFRLVFKRHHFGRNSIEETYKNYALWNKADERESIDYGREFYIEIFLYVGQEYFERI